MARPREGEPRFLIVRRDNIGDLVCTTPLIAALRAAHPDAHIAALVNTYNDEVLARNPALDAVHAYEKVKHRRGSLLGNLFSTARLNLELRARRFDHVLVPVDSPHSRAIARRIAGRETHFGAAASPGQHEVERREQQQHRRTAGKEHGTPARQLDEEAGEDRPEGEAGVDRADGDAVGAPAALGRHGVGDERGPGCLYRGRAGTLQESKCKDGWDRRDEPDGDARECERPHAELVKGRLVGRVT